MATETFPPLDAIRVAAPCKADWAEMTGDDRVRACALCRKNVFNLSAMTREEAVSLLQSKEGRVCVRFYRRDDGTLLTENCPVGLRALRRRLAWIVGAAAALLTTVLAVAGTSSAAGRRGGEPTVPFTRLRQFRPLRAALDWLFPNTRVQVTMGEMSMPPAPYVPPSGGNGATGGAGGTPKGTGPARD